MINRHQTNRTRLRKRSDQNVGVLKIKRNTDPEIALPGRDHIKHALKPGIGDADRDIGMRLFEFGNHINQIGINIDRLGSNADRSELLVGNRTGLGFNFAKGIERPQDGGVKLLGLARCGQLIAFAAEQFEPDRFFEIVEQPTDHRLTDIHRLGGLGHRTIGHKGIETFKFAQVHNSGSDHRP